MKPQELIDRLQKIIDQGFGDLEVVPMRGASNSAYYIGSVFDQEVWDCERSGPLCDMEIGDKFIQLTLDN